ncbi:acyl-CoA carboxylase subunit epsilon [Mycobacterium persicum]|uniref:acyl-CoA carboxylase subunit epsilon n=1 Tax=Mycobacterium persicum TaxID=1487726 RepID=UPI001F07F347|nr:acyl-CoA carboxylase subunit epsilon [Mycobacterium persicum]
MSRVSAASDGDESRVSGASAMIERNETDETNTTDPAPQPHERHIEIVQGHPTDQELAALIAVLGSVSGAPPAPETEPTRWGLPVDKLRFPVFSWQRITLQEMLHMRR